MYILMSRGHATGDSQDGKEEQMTKMVLKMANKSKLLAQIAKVVNYPAGTRKCGMILGVQLIL